MCGIVAATAQRGVQEILIEGLKRLRYRGYDSAEVALQTKGIERSRAAGKVAALEENWRHPRSMVRSVSPIPVGQPTAFPMRPTRTRTCLPRCGRGSQRHY